MVPLTVGQVQCRLWHGLIPAVPVPCNASGEIDLAAQRAYVAWMAEQPIAGVAVWVHTGRGLHLKHEQRLQVLGSWCEGLGANKLIIAGVGGSPERAADFSDYVASALEMARDAMDNGAHAFLVHPPRLFHHAGDTRETLLTYHREIASTGVPQVLFYLYEAAGGVAYSDEQLRELMNLPGMAGIKVATLDSVMTYQRIADFMAREFPKHLLLTGEDRFFGYSLMCGAQAALIGMGSASTALQARMMAAFYESRTSEFLELSRKVDRLSQATFIPPMEGYIRRMLWALVHQGVISRDAAHDPWGPALPESEYAELGKALADLGESAITRPSGA